MSKSIIEELDRIEKEENKYLFVESRANNVIVAAINLLNEINESFSPEETDELTRRLLNSIKGQDPRKFQRKIRELKEGKTSSKGSV